MKIWLDDIRDPPDDTWTVYRDAEDLILALHGPIFWNLITEMSLDHDLGLDRLTGYDVILCIEYAVFELGRPFHFDVKVHSANPVGRSKMELEVMQMESTRL